MDKENVSEINTILPAAKPEQDDNKRKKTLIHTSLQKENKQL